MLKTYRTEIHPTLEQKVQIDKTIGVCRFIYNFYLARNQEVYKETGKFLSAVDFSKWLNNEYLPSNPDKSWIKEVSTVAVRQSINNAEGAFKRFFKHQSGYPKFKKKGISDVKVYFVRSNASRVIKCERHRVKVPILGWVRLKEKGYIPCNSETHIIRSGTISRKAGRYFISVLVEEPDLIPVTPETAGIGIDLGLTSFAVVSNGMVYRGLKYETCILDLEKRLRRAQRSLSRMREARKLTGLEGVSSNYKKQLLKVQRLHLRIQNLRTDYLNKVVSELVKTKPAYITIEDLNVSGMMKNRHLSRAISRQGFREFRDKLESKCRQLGIELRLADRWYASSKTCHECGLVNKGLTLSDRVFRCGCGNVVDRDYNASMNLRDTVKYAVVT